ncbi:MAG: ABC transporter substrate-binding protein, partial [Opitutae bacterium]|nr:ABC transporter substrate-binding protein [Opitutae bacterium]
MIRTHSVRLGLNFLVAFCQISTFDRSTLPATPGVTSDTVIFGQSATFSGQNGKLGKHYKAGIEAAFGVRNDRGGVNGRSLKLISFDDAYEPSRAAANAEMFVSEDNVLAVIGGVGTPTAKRIVPVLKTAKIPFVGPFTGADFLRNANLYPNVINL